MSDQSAVSVTDKGLVIVGADFVGTAQITITSGSDLFENVEKKVTVTVKPGQNQQENQKGQNDSDKQSNQGKQADRENGQNISSGQQSQSLRGQDTTGAVKVSTPKKTTLKSVKNNKKKSITVQWAKVKNAKGYEIQYAGNKSFSKRKKTKTTKNTKIVLKKLKKGNNYYVRVRAYNLDGNNDKVYGKWSKVKKIKVMR